MTFPLFAVADAFFGPIKDKSGKPLNSPGHKGRKAIMPCIRMWIDMEAIAAKPFGPVSEQTRHTDFL
jgi:hypothetical protein